MRIGFHVSIQGGFSNAARRAQALGCNTLQLFCQSPRSWRCREADDADIDQFTSLVETFNISPVCVHLPYLANLCAADKHIYQQTLHMLTENLIRSDRLGAAYLILHPGSRRTDSLQSAFRQIAGALDTVLSAVPSRVMLLLETTAGQGADIGYRFEHFREIFRRIAHPERVGICLDTAHVFQAGYDIATGKGLEETLAGFHDVIGRDKLKLMHLNDSKTACGSRVDRHWHISKGGIKTEGFRRILNHPFLRSLPAIMETPKKEPGDDLMNMRTVKRLLNPGPKPTGA